MVVAMEEVAELTYSAGLTTLVGARNGQLTAPLR
jgi:hypothetical protein